MLEVLKIKNLAIIDEVQISFQPGLNILSGETGAGKSIVIEAISLILGSRATSQLIRSQCENAVVEGAFDLSLLPRIKQRIEDLGFPTENDELVIKRILYQSGKHRIYINGEIATLAQLQKAGEGLVDLCGQHEHQSLLKQTTQLELLDRLGELTSEAKAFEDSFKQYKSLIEEKEFLDTNGAIRTKQIDFLKFQIDELKESHLEAEEDEKLQEEKRLLQTSETRLVHSEKIRQSLESDEGGAISALKSSLQRLKDLLRIDPDSTEIGEISTLIESSFSCAEEAALKISRYIDSISHQPDRLEEIHIRLSKLAELKRKYGASVQEMLSQLHELEAELSQLLHSNDRLQEIDQEIQLIETQLRNYGKKLSEKRKKASQKLARSVTQELKDLKMSDALFSVQLTPHLSPNQWNKQGIDEVQFLVQTNKGGEPRPLGKIASGGELSRLMLSIRRVIADHGGIGVYLFDEIDTGVGGQTAFEVGRKLKSVSALNQVICITHLPQVAVFADHHLSVQKHSSSHRTITQVTPLSNQDRKEEIARMLGGPKLTPKSIENANELIHLAQVTSHSPTL